MKDHRHTARFTTATPRIPLTLSACVIVTVSGCATLANWTAPEKTALVERKPSAAQADALFWQTLHGGHYDRIPDALTAMTAAYLESPEDATTAAHLGFLHVWKLSERERLDELPPTITDNAVLGRKYFEEAVRLDPEDARTLGFYGSLLLAEASIHHDEKLTRKGYFTLLDAVDDWPEFNYFTAGYALSSRPHDSARFQEGLDYQWKNLDVCAGIEVDREQPDYSKFMALETQEGPKRACWNSWIAPHNFEGFFLNMGDMLVKAGNVPTAQKIYDMAKLSRDYGAWKYRAVLEARIRDAESNVQAFRQPNPAPGTARIMSQSRFSCMACHEK